jgi:hypothetical protein
VLEADGRSTKARVNADAVSSLPSLYAGTTIGTIIMSLNPDGAAAGFDYQAGATAYLIDPAGTYSLAGASTPTIDPAGADSGAGASAPTLAAAGVYIPIARATSAVAEIVDAAGAYSPAGASVPTTDPAGPYNAAGASAPTLVAAGASIPIAGAASAEAEIVDPAGAYSPAGASAPTTDPAGAGVDSAGASSPTPADSTHIPGAGAISAATEIAGASAPTLAAAGVYVPITEAPSAAAEIAGPHSSGASAPTLAAPGGYIPVAEATSAATKIASPPGTYLPPGATAPIADPGGTYSAAGATAYTLDYPGTYSSPYALNRLFIVWKNTTPDNTVLSFNSETAVANYYGVGSRQDSLAKEFFARYAGTSATMMFTRLGIAQRPHLLGANIGNLTLSELQSISGSLAITFQGYTYSGEINLSGVQSFKDAALAIQTALNSHLQVAAVTAGSSISRQSVSFMGSANLAILTVNSVQSGTLVPGTIVSGNGIKSGTQIIDQLNGTPGGAGEYALFTDGGNVSSEAMTGTYGELTVGAVNSGTVALGQKVTGAGVLPQTAIEDHISGSGPGSTWVVNNAPAQNIAGETMTMRATPLEVIMDWQNKPIQGATGPNDFFDVTANHQFGFDNNPSSLTYMSGTAAAALGLTQASGAIDASPGGQHLSISEFMNNLVQNLVQNQKPLFGSFQSNKPKASQRLAAWAQSTDGLYTFLPQIDTTPPAGSSLPTTDPAGTWSGQGASAPTPAAPGTYIPFAGATSAAAEITDLPGTYSLAGASAPTKAQPGFYVSTAGASSETPVSAGFYQPHAGATKELPDLAPTISGAVGGQSTPSGQPDTPFSFVTIKDPNIDTSDSLSITLTGGGGTLAGSGLTESAPGVYLLSGTAAEITSELDAVVFTPNTFHATTKFTLTDTTSLGTNKTNEKTTVTVTKGHPVVASVSKFLADPSKYDQTPDGFDILDGTANISANLDQLNDPHIDEIVVSNNLDVVASVQQLTTDQAAIKNLQNANHSPARLAIKDTATNVQLRLSTLVADTAEIGSITVSGGTIGVSATTFLADQSTLDKIVGGFDVSDTAAHVVADLDQLNDPNIAAITISDNGQITASVAQLTTDATAIGDLKNANPSLQLAINDTAGAVQTGLSTLAQDPSEIGSITTSFGPIVVSAGKFLADQSTLDKIVGGFDVSDTAANVAADLPALNADAGNVDAITADIGDGTLTSGVNAPSFSETGWGTSLTVSEALLTYAGVFTQGSGSTTAITAGDTLSLTGTAILSGTTSGSGTLTLGGSAKIDKGGTISVSNWSISGAGADVTLDKNLSYAGSFSEGADDTFMLSGGHLLLSGAATFAGGTVDGSNFLYTEGTTTVSGLTIGGTVEWENTNAVNQSSGNVTLGDNIAADEAILYNTPKATYDILDDSGIGLGASTTSYIHNGGLLEKTGGTQTSTVAPSVTNTGTIKVAAATLDLQGAVTGKGSDEIFGASTLQFDASVAAGQTVDLSGVGGEVALHKPGEFAGQISGFDTTGAGSEDKIEVAEHWVFTGFQENAGGTKGTLGFKNNNIGSTISLTLLGDYSGTFTPHTQANGSTVITYTGAPGLDSLLHPAGGARGDWGAGGFGVPEAGGSARGDWGAGVSFDGSVGHAPGPSG